MQRMPHNLPRPRTSTTDHLSDHGVNKSILRWAGSKRKLIPELGKFYTDDSMTYIEPFAGSAVLFFHVSPARAHLSDLNPHLINALSTVRRLPDEVHKAASRILRDSETFYRVRKKFNSQTGSKFQLANGHPGFE